MCAAVYDLRDPSTPAAEPAEAAAAAPAALRVAALDAMFRSAPSVTIIEAVAAVALWSTFRTEGDDLPVIAWAAAAHGSQALMLSFAALRRLANGAALQSRRWLVLYLVALASSAAAWGAAPWLLLPGSADVGLGLVTVTLLCVASVGLPCAVPCRPALLLWLLPLLSPLFAALVVNGGPQAVVLAPLTLAVAGVTLLIGDGQHRQLLRALRAQLDDAALSHRLREQLQRADESSRDKSRFLATASHDLRQPLHALGLFASALDRRVTDPAGRPLLRNVNRCIDALNRSFNALLDVSKLDAGVVEPDLQSFAVRDVFRRLHMQFAGHAESRGLALRFKPGGKFVRSDPQLLERVLGNLIQNALRYTASGGVTVLARSRAHGVRIEVWDTGRGIAESELPSIFDEFYRGSGSEVERSRGLGMGLAIVKRLVLLLGHPLTVRSTPGRGTMVAVWVPRTDLDALHGMNFEAETVPQPLGELQTLLVVDDDDQVREGTALLLSQWGYDVVTADSAADACQAAMDCAGTLQGMICDLRLRNGECGLQTIDRVRSVLGHPLPALLLTGDTSPKQVTQLHDSGRQVLFKPVRPRDLYLALRRLA